MSNIQHTIREKALAALAELTQGEVSQIVKGLQLLVNIIGHFDVNLNGGPIAPANSIGWASHNFTFFGENALVIAGISVETQAADQTVQYALVRDGITTFVTSQSDVSTGKFGSAVLAWIDSGNAQGSTHTYEITATNSTLGQSVTVPQAGQAWIVVIELA